jgi:beta-aspartyl-peptidase (threonine type)
MEKSPHVMLTGKGAEQFAAANNSTIVDPSYFFTQERWDALQLVKVEDSINQQIKKRTLIMKDSVIKNDPVAYRESHEYHTSRFGTVGAVALDMNGTWRLVPARWNDQQTMGPCRRCAYYWGRDLRRQFHLCGKLYWLGEYFIRAVVAKTISDQIKYAGLPVAKAAQNSLEEVAGLGGDGGLIALDKDGNYTMPFNTGGMYRGVVKANGKNWCGNFQMREMAGPIV